MVVDRAQACRAKKPEQPTTAAAKTRLRRMMRSSQKTDHPRVQEMIRARERNIPLSVRCNFFLISRQPIKGSITNDKSTRSIML
jgi:DNA-binding transcriptional regulator YbjK